MLKELLEMAPPYYTDTELPKSSYKVAIISLDTLKEAYTVINTVVHSGHEVVIALHNSKTGAIIGNLVRRYDDVISIEIVLSLTFYRKNDLESLNKYSKLLHVEIVTPTDESYSRRGYGYLLYTTLLNAGYIIVSDGMHYKGGRKLWEKIIKNAQQDGFHIYIYIIHLRDIKRNKDSTPIEYTWDTIDPTYIWGDSLQHHINLFLVASKNKLA